MTDGEAFQQYREPPFEDFRIGQPGIGHVGLHRVGAVEIRPGARSTANGFVILIGVGAEGEIVHRPLGRRQHAERAVKGVGHALGRLYVAGDDGGGMAGVQHAAFGDDDVEGLQAASVEGNVIVNQGAEDVKHGRLAHGGGGVEVVLGLLRGAGEINAGAAAVFLDRDIDLDAGAVVHLQRERPVLEDAENPAHRFLRIVLDVPHVGPNHVESEVSGHLPQFPGAFFVGGDLGLQVGQVLARVAGRMRALFQ